MSVGSSHFFKLNSKIKEMKEIEKIIKKEITVRVLKETLEQSFIQLIPEDKISAHGKKDIIIQDLAETISNLLYQKMFNISFFELLKLIFLLPIQKAYFASWKRKLYNNESIDSEVKELIKTIKFFQDVK